MNRVKLMFCAILLWLRLSVNWKMWKARRISCFGWCFIIALMVFVSAVITLSDALPRLLGVHFFYYLAGVYLLVIFRSIYCQEKQKKQVNSLAGQKNLIISEKRQRTEFKQERKPIVKYVRKRNWRILMSLNLVLI